VFGKTTRQQRARVIIRAIVIKSKRGGHKGAFRVPSFSGGGGNDRIFDCTGGTIEIELEWRKEEGELASRNSNIVSSSSISGFPLNNLPGAR